MIETGKTLIAYFSWSGNTQEIAKQIHEFAGGDLVEIKPATDSPLDYNSVLDVAKQEFRSENKPELKDMPYSIEAYDNIFISYPNWWNTFPAPISTFLSEFNFTDKTIIPFCTHGGGGIGHSIENVRKQCPDSELLEALSINGNQVWNANSEVEKWLQKVLKLSISKYGK